MNEQEDLDYYSDIISKEQEKERQIKELQENINVNNIKSQLESLND